MTDPTAPVPPRLRMAGVTKRYGPTVALSGVDLEVRGGEVHALIGQNGAGKSTLMKILSGAEHPDAGRLWLDGSEYTPRSPADGRRAGVGMIYQELSLAPHLDVAENIALGAETTRGWFVDRSRADRAAAEALGRLGRADIRLRARVADLPPADRQVVEIARAVSGGCRVLVLDEPTSSLTGADADRLITLVRGLRDRGVGVVYISHALDEIRRVADRFTVLRDGRAVGSGGVRGTTDDAIVTMMIGRPLGTMYPRSPRRAGDVLLRVEGLSAARGPANIGLELRRGEVLGIAGLIGAGRTELLRAIFGLDEIRSGTVRAASLTGRADPPACWRAGMGMVSEDRKHEGLALGLSIAENMCLPVHQRFGGAGVVSAGRERRAVGEWMSRFGVRARSGTQRVSELSGGNQQKVALARLLLAECDVLLLDEPTRGIDIASKALIYALIDALASGAGGGPPLGVLMVSSDHSELLGVCDRIAVMRRGVLGAFRPASELDEHIIVREAAGVPGEHAA